MILGCVCGRRGQPVHGLGQRPCWCAGSFFCISSMPIVLCFTIISILYKNIKTHSIPAESSSCLHPLPLFLSCVKCYYCLLLQHFTVLKYQPNRSRVTYMINRYRLQGSAIYSHEREQLTARITRIVPAIMPFLIPCTIPWYVLGRSILITALHLATIIPASFVLCWMLAVG